MTDITRQIEEIESLLAIYGDDFQAEDEENKSYSINICNNRSHMYIKLYIKLPFDYPSKSPPTFEISAPYFNKEEKEFFFSEIQKIYWANVGENCIFQCIEKVREEFLEKSLKLEDSNVKKVEETTPTVDNENVVDYSRECPKILHSEIINDRKSSFQAHAAKIFSLEQVRQVINELKKNKKIERATHNILAYRILNNNNNTVIHDCDDDGENQAGSRLLHLLEIMKMDNVIVVVSRWYGGIQLGPNRFKHINNAARQVLTLILNDKK